MSFNSLLKATEVFASRNAPAILTGVGIAGAFASAFLAGKGAFKASGILSEEAPDLTTKRKIDLTWQCYIPAALALTATTAAIFSANHIGATRLIAVSTAYSITERAYDEYRDKVAQKFGPKQELAARDEIAQDRVTQNPVGLNPVLVTGTGDSLCYDAYSMRYFRSNMEAIRKAGNDVNEAAHNDEFCSLADFYDKLNLPSNSHHELMGWHADHLLKLNISSVMADNDQPAISMDFYVAPKHSYRYDGM